MRKARQTVVKTNNAEGKAINATAFRPSVSISSWGVIVDYCQHGHAFEQIHGRLISTIDSALNVDLFDALLSEFETTCRHCRYLTSLALGIAAALL